MKIGIIGAGFTGLAAGLKLVKKGEEVTIIEGLDKAGGLALGFKEKDWKWTVEAHYHHLFTSDYNIINLATEINHKIVFVRPKTSTWYKGKIYQLDSPVSLLMFSPLSLFSRIRTGITLFYLRVIPFLKYLEHITAKHFILNTMGDSSWKVLWEPLFVKKFGKYASKVAAIWFWARIKKRSSVLGYPEGGFEMLAENLVANIKRYGGKLFFSTPITRIFEKDGKIVVISNDKRWVFDKVICTLPVGILQKLLPENVDLNISKLEGLGAVNLILSLKNRLLNDNTYWLNINDLKAPFLAVVEHTNFIDKGNYGGENLVYIGNYLETSHKYFKMSDKQLINEYFPYLKKINPDIKKEDIKRSWVFKANFAQPIIDENYSEHIPATLTTIANLYLANMQQVYPWDRGTNYAVELGERVAEIVTKK